MVLADAVCRMLPDVLSDHVCFEEESHYNGLLEYPQYTRPANFRGKEVPAILLSGHHANIQRWRREQSLLRTAKYRPDLIEKAKQSGSLTDEDLDYLSQIADELEENRDSQRSFLRIIYFNVKKFSTFLLLCTNA